MDQRRVGRRYFRAMYGVLCAVLEQKRQEGEAGVDKEGNDEDVDQEEDEKGATHGELLSMLPYGVIEDPETPKGIGCV